ncbi:unnamed protein product [Closterium sp. Naga37s-1]|nr:unnamed protein product [Closterium sp. Naga37s-1]
MQRRQSPSRAPLQLASTSHHPSSLHPFPPLPSSIALPSWEGRKSQLAALSPLFPSPSPLLVPLQLASTSHHPNPQHPSPPLFHPLFPPSASPLPPPCLSAYPSDRLLKRLNSRLSSPPPPTSPLSPFPSSPPPAVITITRFAPCLYYSQYPPPLAAPAVAVFTLSRASRCPSPPPQMFGDVPDDPHHWLRDERRKENTTVRQGAILLPLNIRGGARRTPPLALHEKTLTRCSPPASPASSPLPAPPFSLRPSGAPRCVKAPFSCAKVPFSFPPMFGDVRDDPHHWLRDERRRNPEVLAHLAAENALTDALLPSCSDGNMGCTGMKGEREGGGEREGVSLRVLLEGEMKARVKQEDRSVPLRKGDFWYYTREEEGKQYPIHCRRAAADSTAAGNSSSCSSSSREGMSGSKQEKQAEGGELTFEQRDYFSECMDEGVPEEIVLDENREAEGRSFFHIDSVVVSPNHGFVAYSLDTRGDERYSIHVRPICSGSAAAAAAAAAAASAAASAILSSDLSLVLPLFQTMSNDDPWDFDWNPSDEEEASTGNRSSVKRSRGEGGSSRAGRRARSASGARAKIPPLALTLEPTTSNKQAEDPLPGPSGSRPVMSDPVDNSPIPELFKGWTASSVKGFRDDFKDLLKAKSKLKKMKELDRQGVILHSIRTKTVEFQTKFASVKEKSAASVSEIHLANQKRLQADFIASKALEIEELQKAVDSHVVALASRMEEYIKSLSADPDLVVSDAAKEKFRVFKGRCNEKANSDIQTARDEIVIRELDRQNKAAAEELKKAAASEEVQEMEVEAGVGEIMNQHAKRIEDKIRREMIPKIEANLMKKLLKNLSLGKQDSPQAPAADAKPKNAPAGKPMQTTPMEKERHSGSTAGNSKPKKKRGGKKKKKDGTQDQQAKGQAADVKAKGPKNGGGGPGKGPHKN